MKARPCPPSFSPSSPELTGTLEFIDDFFLLYAPVLKPDCHLSLCQICLRGYPSPFVLGDEFIGGILPFQFFELHLGVWHTLLSPTANRTVSNRYGICGEENAALLFNILDFIGTENENVLQKSNSHFKKKHFISCAHSLSTHTVS